jgi:uncharacterized protein YjiS (DUF1127 family)
MSCRSIRYSNLAPPKAQFAESDIAHISFPFRWIVRLRRMRDRWRQRQALLALDDRLLRDIGITREQAEREACKPFWK